MKTILRKVYFALMAPLYRRLSRDLTLENQRMLAELLKSEEQFSATYRRELVSLSARFQQLEERLTMNETESLKATEESSDLIDRQIAEIVSHIDKSNDLIAVSRAFGLSLEKVLAYEKRYRGMNALGVQRARRLENEIAELRQKNG